MRWRAILALALAALASAGGARQVRSLFDGADPFALPDNQGNVWIYPTGNGSRLDAWRCSSPSVALACADAGPLVSERSVGWIGDDGARTHFLWAPDMLADAGRYYFYYAVGPQNPTPSRLGVAVCDTPAGPCRDSGKPLLTGGPGFEAIDPMVFVDRRSGLRLLYAGGSAGAKLRAYELSPDLISINRELPIAQPPLFTEGVFLHERNGIYYLSWSHGHWDRSDYSVLYAMSASPLGPWNYRGVLLHSDARFKGPGHHAFFQDRTTGDWYIVYHRWENQPGDGPYRGSRRIVVQRIRYKDDGEIEPIAMD